MTLAPGARVIATDANDAPGTVTDTPRSYWQPGTAIKRHPPGVVWVAFDNGVGAPWAVDALAVVSA